MSQRTAVTNRRAAQTGSETLQRRPATSTLIVLAVLLAGVLLSWLALGEAQPAGRLFAASSRFDAGTVGIRDGLVQASFPLTVEGEIIVAEIKST